MAKKKKDVLDIWSKAFYFTLNNQYLVFFTYLLTISTFFLMLNNKF